MFITAVSRFFRKLADTAAGVVAAAGGAAVCNGSAAAPPLSSVSSTAQAQLVKAEIKLCRVSRLK